MNIMGLYTDKDLEGIYNLSKQLRETRKELQRKDNIINELKELCDEYDTKQHLDDTIYIDETFKKNLEDIINGN
jgi:Mg2+ and Co2+ transporter CorA